MDRTGAGGEHGSAGEHGTAGDLRPFSERFADALAAAQAGASIWAPELAALGDGLPLVVPTSAALEEMLAGRDPDGAATTCPVPISFAVPTWFDLAANALLAGCPTGVLDVVAAAIDAATDPAFNLLGVQATTGGRPLVVVHGPIVTALGLNAGANALGPGWRANATIGRAVRLVLQNVGISYPGEADMATQGHPGKYTWLVAENQPASPWEALSAARGLGPRESGVTVFPGVGNVEVVLGVDGAADLADLVAGVLAGLGAPRSVLLLPPESAHLLDRQGWDRSRLGEDLVGRGARAPLTVVTGGAGVKATLVPGWGGPAEAVTRALPDEAVTAAAAVRSKA